MEGVGARLGRSSTRYGPTSTVFNGPVRKWKKKWVHVAPSSTNASANHHSQASTNGTNGAHLQLYKWTPITQSQNNNGGSNGDKIASKDDVGADDATDVVEEPPRRKFKYVPVALLEEQKEDEAMEKDEDETKPTDTNSNAAEPASTSDSPDEKPDINDVPMEEYQGSDDNLPRQDLNESTLDLSLNLNSNEEDDPDSDAKPEEKNKEEENNDG